MAKLKGRRGDRHPEPAEGHATPPVGGPQAPASTPQRPGRLGLAAPALARAGRVLWRDPVLLILLMLALAATAFIWLRIPFADDGAWGYLHQPLSQRRALILTAALWVVALIGALERARSRRTVRRLEAVIAHDDIVSARLEPQITEEQSGLRMRHISAWLVAVLGIVASAVFWQADAIERALSGPRSELNAAATGHGNLAPLSTLIVGTTVSVMLALAVAANAINRLKGRRLARDFRAALNSQRLALDTLGGLDALISACLPTGERTRFNERFLRFVGKSAAQMHGMGWLEVVHPEDRQRVMELIARPLDPNEAARQYDLCVRDHAGDYGWLHETLVPRFDGESRFIEFIATAINITAHVQNEAALDKQIGELKSELAGVNAALEELKAEHSKTKTSRSRFEKSLEESREEAKNLHDALNRAEAAIEKTKSDAAEKLKEARIEAHERVTAIETAAESRVAKSEEALKSARQELLQSAAENRKLTRAFEKLQEEMGQLREQDGGLREQIARHIKETREAKSQATEAGASEAQHRAKSDRLTQRCDELEAQCAAHEQSLAAARGQAQQASGAITAEVERRLHEVSAEALAAQLSTQVQAMQRMTAELLSQALDGPAQDAVQNAAAAAQAINHLVEGVTIRERSRMGRPDQSLPTGSRERKATGRIAAFDLRRTANGVHDLLRDSAAARGVALRVEPASNLPALVHGDDVQLRAALLSIAQAALHLADDGTLVMRLSEDINTAAHSTIRCELSHPSARVKPDALDAAMAIKATDDTMPDPAKQPLAHQAAKAWQVVRDLKGQHGFLLPDEGGFAVWFTFTLGRPAATGRRSDRPEPVQKASVNESPPQPGAATATTEPQAQSRSETLARARPASRTTATAPAAATAASIPPAEPAAARVLPRMPQEFLSCNLGEVVELGADSMRVVCAKPPKRDQVSITFNHVETDMELRAEVLWSKKVASRQHDVGLKFVGLTGEQQKRILSIVMQHRKVKTMLDNQ